MSLPNHRALAEATAAGTVLQLVMVIPGRWAPVVASAVAGGVCALIGIAVSFALGDVPAMVLALGSAVIGAIGGAAVAVLTRRPDASS